jgi:hypothetical protein
LTTSVVDAVNVGKDVTTSVVDTSDKFAAVSMTLVVKLPPVLLIPLVHHGLQISSEISIFNKIPKGDNRINREWGKRMHEKT